MKEVDIFKALDNKQKVYFATCFDYKYHAISGYITGFARSTCADSTYEVQDLNGICESLSANNIYDNMQDAELHANYKNSEIKKAAEN